MRDSHPSEESVMTRDDIIKQALEALEIGYTSAKAEADQFHAAMAGYRPHRHAQMDADVQKIARAITALRAALEQQEQEPVAMLWKVRKALALASAICDRVPNRWHHTHEIGSAEADIGDMVNAHPDGTHGYRLIQEAEAELVAYLTTPEAAPQRQSEPEQEPVAWIQSNHLQKAQREPFLCRVEPTQRLPDFVPIYTNPPRREWQGLTEEEIWKLYYDERVPEGERCDRVDFARAIEAALKEKNK